MLNKLKVVALAGLAVVAIASPAFAGKQDFTVHNKTGMTLKGIYVSAASAKEWEDNMLDGALKNGEEVELTFDGYDECKFDLKAVDAAGKAWEVYGINLCEVSEFTLEKKGGKVVYSTDVD